MQPMSLSELTWMISSLMVVAMKCAHTHTSLIIRSPQNKVG